MTWIMPAETDAQERVWMAFPRQGPTLGDDPVSADAARDTWSEVAAATARFTPVTMLVDPSETEEARKRLGEQAGVTLQEREVHEFWMRDTGPTFVRGSDGHLGAVDWSFNGWGNQSWAQWRREVGTAADVSAWAGAVHLPSLLVLEGGGIHVDGAGTVLVTETVLLDPDRNPFADRERVDAELQRMLGVGRVIWLSRGLTRDYSDFGTRGHIDIVATFSAPGEVLLHWQDDPEHPDYEVCRELLGELESALDARGERLRVTKLPAPSILRDEDGFVDYSYVNHLVTNGGVIACHFGDDEADSRARSILAAAYPGREVVGVDARELFARGGGIHCITQQQPVAQTGV